MMSTKKLYLIVGTFGYSTTMARSWKQAQDQAEIAGGDVIAEISKSLARIICRAYGMESVT